MAPVGFGCLLFTTERYVTVGYSVSNGVFKFCFGRPANHNDFGFPEFIIKPDSLLLEDEKSEAGSTGNNKKYLQITELRHKRRIQQNPGTTHYSRYNYSHKAGLGSK